MARINIEDSLFEDPRFFNLAVKLGSRETALGALVLAWRVAQKCFVSSDRFIPLELWNKRQLKNEIIESELATVSDRFVKMVGIEEQFIWLLQRQKAGQKGGIKSGENRKKTKRPLATAQENEATVKPPSSFLLTQEKNNTILAQFDLESIYQKYPRKLGKSDGLKKLAKSIKTTTDFEDLVFAVDNFIRHHTNARTKIEFIPHFKTFATNWRDWVDPDTSWVNSDQPDFSGIE